MGLGQGGSACCGHAVVMCPLHKQEPLELFCETCDLLACSICHLSAHKDHRLVHVSKALLDQQWLLENLMARVEEKRTAVENTAKQIQGRFHSVKITQRKAENQIKMAKMIMMNELNKRANLLIEQLESISSGFKRHLEDQLQGAIELCSQLEHVQNFITWAAAHHRRNPLLFSKELIALQMQQLLEPLIQTETLSSLKIKFNWDASFWTKQISTLGQLSVEGGSHSFSDGVGRPSILRPQPVPCMTMSSLCYPVRGTDCAYQSFCQPQPCCLHCRPAQSVPLEKYPLSPDKYSVTCTQQPSCSSPSNLQRHYDSEGTAGPPQLNVNSSLNPTVPDLVQQRSSGTTVKEPATSDPPQCEHNPTIPEPAVLNSKKTDQPVSSTEQVLTCRNVTDLTTDQQDQPAEQQSSELGATPGKEQQSLKNNQEKDVRTPVSDMLARDEGCGSNSQSKTSPETVNQLHSILAEPSSSNNVSYEPRPSGDAQCLATVTEDQACTEQQDNNSFKVTTLLHPESCDSSSQTTYKSEPDNVGAYALENIGSKSDKTYRTSRKVQGISKKASKGSKVPIVCLKRLKILVSKRPPQGLQRIGAPDFGLKSEGSFLQELDRELSTEELSSEKPAQEAEDYPASESPPAVHYSDSFGNSEQSMSELCNDKDDLQELSPPNTSDQSSDQEPSLQHQSEEEHTPNTNPAEPRSVPEFNLQPESSTEADFISEAEVESELQAESEPSFRSKPQVESDLESDVESEQPPELALSAESEVELESEPDSTAEVTLNLEQECEWEAEQIATDLNAQSELATGNREQVEIESEDFCAVCLIGGELLCCDRCPKVFHLACHVPSLLSFPTGDWVCTLCRNLQRPEVEYDCENTRLPACSVPSGLSLCDQRKCEKLTLLIYSNILSAPFHEPVSPLARHYYQIIKRPMDLSVIRSRLNKNSPAHYDSPAEFVTDVLLMFKNCAKFNYPDSEVAQAGLSLQSFFLSKLSEVFPELSCFSPEDDVDSDDYEEAESLATATFPWPERREQSHRKRKRRRSFSMRRHQY
ncbi:tripartite motif-containing protein 66 [Trichomycterus rosablanca]|uniref:tripartite motif-containing protein 66 n=1 Tax=Trichomycterus rosablanca TaxID=2290929 RepID=UPI002F35F36F